ncbi:MAG: hypothetical protein IH933_10920, partial [Euryarchaeota archaeon]|nr:hypothetical protein [Euryarchaeota archaeon]
RIKAAKNLELQVKEKTLKAVKDYQDAKEKSDKEILNVRSRAASIVVDVRPIIPVVLHGTT